MIARYSLTGLFVALLCANVFAEFTPITGWDRQVFPSYLIATAAVRDRDADEKTLGDGCGSFGVSLVAPRDNAKVKVKIVCEAFAKESEFVGVLPKKGETYQVFPKMLYFFDRLAACRQATPSMVVFQVQLDDGPQEQTAVTVTMRSINDCPFAVIGDESEDDLGIVFAAYVNEQHPFVDQLLREALDVGMVDSFIGYQSGNEKDVFAQVYALWDLMVTRDMRYSSITATAALSLKSRSQHVRLLEETVNNSQGNCVDGSVLFASMLRKIGIDSVLILTQNHCYIGFWTDAKHEGLYGLETTMISLQTELDQTPELLNDAVSEELRWDHSWASFVKALGTGSANLEKDIKKTSPEVNLIDIASARLHGILPIPFDGKQQFVAANLDFELDEAVAEGDEEMAVETTSEEAETEEDHEELTWDSDSKPRKRNKSKSELTW